MAGVMCETAVKKPRLDESVDDHFFDIDESSSLTSCSDESRYSYQGYETAWVKDSGDDWSPSSSHSDSDGDATDVIYEVQYEEYELASDSSSGSEQEDNSSSSSGESSDTKNIIIPIIEYELDDDGLAGSESVSSDEDYIIRTSPPPPPGHPQDRWKCRTCGIQNHPPMSYCHSCWTRRKDWLGPPRSRKRKRKAARSSSSNLPDSQGCSQGSGPSSQDASACAASSSSSGFSSQGSVSTDDGVDASAKSSVAPASSNSVAEGSAAELCGACGIRRPNGAFMHGKTGHMIYCYPCSKHIWQARKQSKCPVCRRTIEKVAKMFFATSSA